MNGGAEFVLRTGVARHDQPQAIGAELAARCNHLPLLCGMLDCQTYIDAAETTLAAVRTITAADTRVFAVTLHGPRVFLESHATASPDDVVMVVNRRCHAAALAEAIKHEDGSRWTNHHQPHDEE